MFELQKLIDHAIRSYEKSAMSISKLNTDILSMEGMSGKKTRHLYNNLCDIEGANYLEVGTWKGSSFISAIFENQLNALAIDNWSEFFGPRQEFFDNMERYCSGQKFNMLEKDVYSVTREEIFQFMKSIDIYLFDGSHTEESHVKAVTHFRESFSKYFIMIIDDWAWNAVQLGTYKGLQEGNIKVHEKIEVITSQDENGNEEYWNGFGLFVCENLNQIN